MAQEDITDKEEVGVLAGQPALVNDEVALGVAGGVQVELGL